ncbi:hypothetical protein MHBO_002336, partial [Bonamia ostreae]
MRKQNEIKSEIRFCDYFVVLKRGKIVKNDSTSLSKIEYSPIVTDRYPLTDYEDYKLSPSIGMFVFPDNIYLLTNPSYTKYSFFTLTNENGVRQFGACLIF